MKETGSFLVEMPASQQIQVPLPQGSYPGFYMSHEKRKTQHFCHQNVVGFFPHRWIFLWTSLSILYFDSLVTLSTWTQHQIPEVKGCVAQDVPHSRGQLQAQAFGSTSNWLPFEASHDTLLCQSSSHNSRQSISTYQVTKKNGESSTAHQVCNLLSVQQPRSSQNPDVQGFFWRLPCQSSASLPFLEETNEAEISKLLIRALTS